MAAQVLVMIEEYVQEGISTFELDKNCHNFIIKNGAKPSSLNYHGFPKSICTSINETVCHGIPTKKVKLQNGDIVNIDVTVLKNGFHGDCSRMYTVGSISPQAKKLIMVAEEAMYKGIEQATPESRLGDIGYAIQNYTEGNGFSVVRDFIGHGIGREFHEDPSVHHVGQKNTGVRLKTGMTFTIEPMINEGVYDVDVLKDGWTVVTKDRKLSAQFEHTILITEAGHEILTMLPGQTRFFS